MSSHLYPARLHYLVVAGQPGLNLEQLLEDVLKWGNEGGITGDQKRFKECRICLSALTPCFMMSLA